MGYGVLLGAFKSLLAVPGGCNGNENMTPRSFTISVRKGHTRSKILGPRISKMGYLSLKTLGKHLIP